MKITYVSEMILKILHKGCLLQSITYPESDKNHWNYFKGHVRKGCVMECRVNGEVVQKTEIAKMIWKVALTFVCYQIDF